MLQNLNNSTLFAGLLTLILNMGGRNTSFALNKKQQQLFSQPWMKYILIFAVFFTSTRNVFLAICLTVLFYLLINHLLNDESEYCMLPESLRGLEEAIDTNKDGVISGSELESAFDKLTGGNGKVGENDENTIENMDNSYKTEDVLEIESQSIKNKKNKNTLFSKVTSEKDDIFVYGEDLFYPIVLNGRGVF